MVVVPQSAIPPFAPGVESTALDDGCTVGGATGCIDHFLAFQRLYQVRRVHVPVCVCVCVCVCMCIYAQSINVPNAACEKLHVYRGSFKKIPKGGGGRMPPPPPPPPPPPQPSPSNLPTISNKPPPNLRSSSEPQLPVVPLSPGIELPVGGHRKAVLPTRVNRQLLHHYSPGCQEGDNGGRGDVLVAPHPQPAVGCIA